MAIKIGITGGIGSGKSVVSRLLAVMGIPVYIADIESKKLANTDEKIREQLIRLLGPDVYCDGKLNKSFLANYLFADSKNAENVNRIIHPHVREDYLSWVERQSHSKFIVMESAILLESGFDKEVDVIVMVYAPFELRLQRAILRDCSSEKLIRERIQNQMDDEEKKKYAHFIIRNDADSLLIPQVCELLQKLEECHLS